MPYSHKNCKEHKYMSGSSRSIGLMRYQQCDICLAIRILFETDVSKDGNWIRLEELHVIEPDFGKDNDNET